MPFDADLLFATQSLIIAHAGLITLFPDVTRTSQELDRYRELTETIDAFRIRVLDPTFEKLTSSTSIFDENTQSVIEEIKVLDELEKSTGQATSQGTTAIKHSWLRGALASIGQYMLKQMSESTKVLRDEAIKRTVANSDNLTSSIIDFLRSSKDALLSLAYKLQSMFGWLETLLCYLGIK